MRGSIIRKSQDSLCTLLGSLPGNSRLAQNGTLYITKLNENFRQLFAATDGNGNLIICNVGHFRYVPFVRLVTIKVERYI